MSLKYYKSGSRLTLLLGCLLLTGAGCRNRMEDIRALTESYNMQEDKAYDVTIIHTEGEKVMARIFADEFIRNQKAQPAFTDLKGNVKVEFFNDSSVIESTLTAGYARIYETRNNILVRDSIVVVNNKGENLETDELIWNQKLQKFFTEKHVKITTPDQVIYGDGLEANQDFSWYVITNIKGIIRVEKEDLPQ